jgi:hypothetical protein
MIDHVIQWIREEAPVMLRIRRKLDSETLHLPELKPLIGRTVDV